MNDIIEQQIQNAIDKLRGTTKMHNIISEYQIQGYFLHGLKRNYQMIMNVFGNSQRRYPINEKMGFLSRSREKKAV